MVYRFARGIDRHDWELVRSCYHDGALDDHGPFKGPVEEYVAWVSEALPGLADMTMHFIGNVLIDLDGDSAQSEAYVVGYHRYRRDDGSRWDWLGGGRYVDHFERRGDWRIVDRVLVWEWVRDDPVEQEWEGFGITGHAGVRLGSPRRDGRDPLGRTQGTLRVELDSLALLSAVSTDPR